MSDCIFIRINWLYIKKTLYVSQAGQLPFLSWDEDDGFPFLGVCSGPSKKE